MKAKYKALLLLFFLVYLLITIYSFYQLFYIHKESKETVIVTKSNREVVEVWGKAAIADFLWSHILNGKIISNENGNIFGKLETNRIDFVYRSGPQLVPNSFPLVSNLVLVVNGRSQEKIERARLWLDYLVMYPNLKNTAVVMLGDEECRNEWIERYLRSRGGLIDILLVVYDWSKVDNKEIFQWPLGVATYRGFPNVRRGQIDLASSRSHVCNFLGTIYRNSSREYLVSVLNKTEQCVVITRSKWTPNESKESVKKYINTLLDSDLTLSPVGINSECYRIYEAMSLGSVPVIEDNVTPGFCTRDSHSPIRLLKEYKAPVIWIQHWSQILDIIKHEEQLTWEEKIDRRTSIMNWYQEFKAKLKVRFINIIEKNFFFKKIEFD